MKKYGLIGKPLGHSYSTRLFRELFSQQHIDALYDSYEVDDLEHLPLLDGFNVTYPYKESILSYLTAIDETARKIGAVNVVKNGVGYNTDYIGFDQSIAGALRPNHTQALVLGTGGVAKAITYALHQRGIATCSVSHSGHGDMDYLQLTDDTILQHPLIVNCTPLGMWPNTNTYPDIPYEAIGKQHLLYDVVYNPVLTEFLRRGQEHGATTINGLQMLQEQAMEAWRIWNNE